MLFSCMDGTYDDSGLASGIAIAYRYRASRRVYFVYPLSSKSLAICCFIFSGTPRPLPISRFSFVDQIVTFDQNLLFVLNFSSFSLYSNNFLAGKFSVYEKSIWMDSLRKQVMMRGRWNFGENEYGWFIRWVSQNWIKKIVNFDDILERFP